MKAKYLDYGKYYATKTMAINGEVFSGTSGLIYAINNDDRTAEIVKMATKKEIDQLELDNINDNLAMYDDAGVYYSKFNLHWDY